MALDIGLDLAGTDTVLPTTVLDGSGTAAVLHGAYGERIDGVSPQEAEAFTALRRKLVFQAGILKRFLRRPPPQIGALSLGDLSTFASAGIDDFAAVAAALSTSTAATESAMQTISASGYSFCNAASLGAFRKPPNPFAIRILLMP